MLQTIAEKANNKWHVLVVNITLLSVGFYATLQKLFGISATNGIARVFSIDAAAVVKTALIFWVAYVCFAKLVLTYWDIFPASLTRQAEPDSINECTLRINDEIKRHILQVETNPPFASQNFIEAHQFDVNILIILENMAEHIAHCFKGSKVKAKDVFISVYKVLHFEEQKWDVATLEYVRHADHKRFSVSSRTIPINDPRFGNYECIKTISTNAPVRIKADCSDYAASPSNRHKTVKHYVGFRLEVADKTVGFINIEFHKHDLFSSDEKLKEFVETDLHAFRSLIEYQFLKKKFFCAVKRLLLENAK